MFWNENFGNNTSAVKWDLQFIPALEKSLGVVVRTISPELKKFFKLDEAANEITPFHLACYIKFFGKISSLIHVATIFLLLRRLT